MLYHYDFRMTRNVGKILQGVEGLLKLNKRVVRVRSSQFEELLNALPQKKRAACERQIPYNGGVIEKIQVQS